MSDESGRDDGEKSWKPRSAPAGAGGGRPFKPSPSGGARPPASGPRKTYPKSFDTQAPASREDSGRPHRPFAKRGEERPGAGGGKPPRPDARPDAPRPRPAAARDAEDGEPAGAMRIAKRLARAGVASRRDAEGMIADGRVRLNGRLLDTPAVTVTAADRIEVDNQPLPAAERTRLWLFHKPAGLVTTNRDPEGRPTVFDRLPEDMPRVLSVGRLDINTEGLLLLTNDGGLARILELPATGWLRRYRVRAHGTVTQGQLDELRQGIALDGVFYGAIEASLDSEKGANVWLTLGLREGKNREVKRILGHLGLDVNRLIRLSFGPFQLGDLPDGAVREIKGRTLRDQLGERLIEEAGADFDAPVVNTFPNQAVTAERRPEPETPKARSEWVSATEARPNKRRFGAAKREDALGRLETKPGRTAYDDARSGARGGERGPARPERPERPDRDRPPRPAYAPRADRPDRPDRAAGPGGRDGAGKAGEERPAAPKGPRRAANVWMAPGARPIGEKRAAILDERAKPRDRPKPVFGKERGPRKEKEKEGEVPRRATAPARVGDRTRSRTPDRDPSGDAPRGRPRSPGPGGGPGAGPASGPGGARGPSGKPPFGGPKRGPRA